MTKKVYHLKLEIKQFKNKVKVITRVFDNIYSTLESIKNLNDIFYNTLLKVELNILEEKD